MALPYVKYHRFEIVGAMLTDVGRVRTSNEDAVGFVIPSKNDPSASRGCLLIVADGMGGHAAGEIASALAVEVVRRVYFSLHLPVPVSLMSAFEAANRAIHGHAKNNADCMGMGTTCTALVICNGQVWLAHVGDSRAYLLRKGRLTRLSKDQTLHAQLIRDGLMTEEESKTAGGGNVITQALGIGPDVVPFVWKKGISLVKGDILILCSDGLWNMVADATIMQLASNASPQEACQNLVDAALEAGGYDNISVGVFQFDEPRFSLTELAATRTISISEAGVGAVSSLAVTSAPGEESCG
jgi:serine/threonine protein phosphatase PrpC